MYWSRLKVFLTLVTLAMVVLGVRLAHLQLSRAEVYRRAAARNLVRPTLLLDTRRGTIRDRTGMPLAEDVPRFDLCVYYPFLALEDESFVRRKAAREGVAVEVVRGQMAPLWLAAKKLKRLKAQVSRSKTSDEVFLGEMADFWPRLAREADLPIESIDVRREEVLRNVAGWRDRVRRAQGRDILIREETYRAPGSVPHAVIEGIAERAKAVVAALQADRPFLVVKQRAERRYRFGDLAGHVVGYIAEVAEEDLGTVPGGAAPVGVTEELRAYNLGDTYGKVGIEVSMEHELRGSRGLERRQRDGTVLERVDAVPGRDVVLTLDVPFQSEVEAFLSRPPSLPPGYGAARGAAVVIDLRTGGILALVSTPRYNPNVFFADYVDLVADTTGAPLLHRAVAGQLSQGSIFKIVTATAALHEGRITNDTALHCAGVLDAEHPNRFRCMGLHGDLSLQRAIRASCNVFFYQVAQMVGGEQLTAWGRRLGFGRKVGLLLPGESAGKLPDGIDPRNLTIGQGQLMVTPLQTARLAALVATGGRMPEVHLVASPRTEPVRQVALGLNPRMMALVRQGLRGVVNEPDGTGYKTVRSREILIAGKTGSAQAGAGRETHSWFIGYAPADRPQIAFAVVFEQAGHGGTVAGPVARRIVETALRQQLITAQ